MTKHTTLRCLASDKPTDLLLMVTNNVIDYIWFVGRTVAPTLDLANQIMPKLVYSMFSLATVSHVYQTVPRPHPLAVLVWLPNISDCVNCIVKYCGNRI